MEPAISNLSEDSNAQCDKHGSVPSSSCALYPRTSPDREVRNRISGRVSQHVERIRK